MVVYEREILLCDFELIVSLDLLRNFDGEIKNLSIASYYIGNEHSAIINEFINKYCSNSLVKLDLGGIKEKTFEHFTMAFLAPELFPESQNQVRQNPDKPESG